MFKRLLILAVFAIFLSTIRYPLCASEDYVVATVGDDKIYYSEVEQAASRLNQFQKENFDANREWKINFIREYVARFAAAKKGVAEGLDKDKEVSFDIEQARRSILAEKMVSADIARINYTEQDVRKYFEQNKMRYRDKERVKVNYIKVKTKEEADEIVARLNKGEKFDKVGKNKIVNYSGWIQEDTPVFGPELSGMPPQSLRGLFSLDVGGYSQSISSRAAESSVMAPRNDKEIEYFIFRIDEKVAAKDLLYEEVKSQVEMEYAKMIKDRTVKGFIRDIFGKEKVVIYEKDIK